MKSKVIIIIAVLVATAIRAQGVYSVPLTFNLDDFSFEKRSAQLFIDSSVLPITFSTDSLSPAMPYVCINVLIGPNDTYSGFSYSETDSLIRENVSLPHNPIEIPTNAMPDNIQPVEIEFNTGSYPTDKVMFTGIHNIGGYQMLCFLVCPFSYDVDGGQLFFDSQIVLSLNLFDDSSSRPKQSFYLKGETIRSNIISMVSNPEKLNISYPVNSQLRAFPGLSESPLKYLIVTCDSLKDEFQKLANWKTEKGYRADIITVEDIYNQYPGRNHPLQIKNAIYDYYQASDGDLEFVLLGGGVNIVPEQKCYAEIRDQYGTKTGNTASDTFYSCFGVMDWDNNQNNKYAELEDSVSLYQNVSLTRLPVNSIATTRHIVEKIIEYERNPNLSGWKDEFLMCGVKMKDYIGTDSLSDVQLSSELLYSSYISGNWNGGKYRFYDTFTDHANGANYDVTANNLQSELSKGYPMAMVNTHGEYYGWMMENGSMYMYVDAKSLASPNYTCIFTQACHTNNIHYDYHSLGCSFLNNVNCGVISYLGSTNLGIGAVGGSLGVTDNYLGGIIDSLKDLHHIGKSICFVKNRNCASGYYYNSNRWNILYLLPLCDPEMPIYMGRPLTFSMQNISHSGNMLSLSIGDGSGRVCVMSRLDGAASFYSSSSEHGLHTPFYPGVECTVCLTLPDYRSFRTIFSSTVNLQNEILADNMNVLADKVYIGSRVVSDRDFGPVTVENGESVISSLNGTNIYNDFEVKLGASLLITSEY